MTTSTARSPSASWPLGVPSSPQSSPAVVITHEFSVARPLPLPHTVSLDSLLEEFEQDDHMRAELAEARKVVGASLYGDEEATLSSLRLAAGLSQAQLAARAATSQSHIARIELGQNDPGTEVIARLAAALGCSEAVVFQAIRAERNKREV